MLFVLYLQVDSSEERARGSRSIDVTCIAVHALVDVALEMVEQVLYASVDFQGIVLVERNIIAEFDVPLEEDWCLNLFIFWYIARKVLHEHTASDLAVGDNMEMLERLNIAEEVAIVVRGGTCDVEGRYWDSRSIVRVRYNGYDCRYNPLGK